MIKVLILSLKIIFKLYHSCNKRCWRPLTDPLFLIFVSLMLCPTLVVFFIDLLRWYIVLLFYFIRSSTSTMSIIEFSCIIKLNVRFWFMCILYLRVFLTLLRCYTHATSNIFSSVIDFSASKLINSSSSIKRVSATSIVVRQYPSLVVLM